MNERGEFEQRPEVKPASSVPLPKEKASPAIKILCVVFALVALGLGGFVVYDKVLNNNTPECTSTLEEDDDEDSVEDKTEAKMTGFVHVASVGIFYVTKNGDVYYDPYDSNLGELYFAGSHDYSMAFGTTDLPGTPGKYTISSKDIDGFSTDDYLAEDNTTVTFDGYKIDVNNIIAVNELSLGQQKTSDDLVLIDTGGRINILELRPVYGNGVAKAKLTKNLGNYENVATAMTVSYGGTMLVLRDGSQVMVDFDTMEKARIEDN